MARFFLGSRDVSPPVVVVVVVVVSRADKKKKKKKRKKEKDNKFYRNIDGVIICSTGECCVLVAEAPLLVPSYIKQKVSFLRKGRSLKLSRALLLSTKRAKTNTGEDTGTRRKTKMWTLQERS